MMCPACGMIMSNWKHWKNPLPTYFQSLENEIRKCSNPDCGVIVFKYKPEGNENRPEWTEEDIERMDMI